MRSSIDQVVDVLNGWKTDERAIGVMLTSGEDDLIKFGGAVVEVSPVALRVFGNDFGLEVNLSVATDFDWQDPRDAPLASRGIALRLCEAVLQIRAPSYLCLLFALKLKNERVDI